MTRKFVRKAFTLVEILIVVVILGILAAVVVPQFTNATQDAQAGNLKSQIKSLQNQIELYAARNNGAYPDLATTKWTPLITGGYIKAAPRNPNVAAIAEAEDVAAAAAPNVGWVWDGTNNVLSATFFDETTGRVTPGTP